MKVFSKPVGEVKYFPVNKNNVCGVGVCVCARVCCRYLWKPERNVRSEAGIIDTVVS